eukprot:scaffold3577_cov114-Skeletonema_dohrnii-CCMP3373.AAC.9
MTPVRLRHDAAVWMITIMTTSSADVKTWSDEILKNPMRRLASAWAELTQDFDEEDEDHGGRRFNAFLR